MIDRATQLQLDDPAAAGALWAKIDRAIVDQAPYVWLINPIAVEFVSERVGNYQFSQQWGSPARSDMGSVAHGPPARRFMTTARASPACLVAQEFGG